MSTELKAWPFTEANSIVEKLERESERGIERRHDDVLLETGYGPSGLPHIGTFAEVARTTWVRYAYEHIADRPTRLVAFSDDMDGLRAAPDNIPNKGMLQSHLGKPLNQIPDPFGEEDSFSGYMNAQLRRFLDHFGFDYEFRSSRDQYHGGVFNEGLERILHNYDAIRDVIIPTLGQKKGDTGEVEWSPFMPICENCGKVYTTRVTRTHPADGEVSYACDQDFRNRGNTVEACGFSGRTSVGDGNVKVGWKVDWALRWYVFGVDYEMYGKDLIESAELSAEIVRILGGEPPVGFFYEMFLDENGTKISKTKGNGLEIDEWLRYGSLESLQWFIYQNPTKAKKLYFDIIPKSVDDYLEARGRFGEESDDEQVNNPVWFIEQSAIREGEELGFDSRVSFSMLLNLVNVLNTDDKEIVWNYVLRYDPEAAEHRDVMDDLLDRALRYYRDFILPTKEYELPPEEMLPAIEQLCEFLESYEGDDPAEIQTATYSAGKEHDIKLGKWFRAMYRMLLGQDRGPRLGTFIHLYGVEETLNTIRERLQSEDE
jgi:lysyl-tRNA synthetase class 1